MESFTILTKIANFDCLIGVKRKWISVEYVFEKQKKKSSNIYRSAWKFYSCLNQRKYETLIMRFLSAFYNIYEDKLS